jgi:predicted transcriptional regulator
VTKHLALTANVVRAYISNNTIPPRDLPDFIATVHAALNAIRTPAEERFPVPRPMVNPKRSVKADHIVCLEDGKKFKSLKRHLVTDHGLTPEAYREKWDLPLDYPMVAPSYAAERSALAKKAGFGKKLKQRTAPKSRKTDSAKAKLSDRHRSR